MKSSNHGFTLIELMIVIAIIACLSIISIPSLMTYLSKAKRSEAYVQLRSLAMAEKAYFAEHGKYTANLSGEDSLNWKPEGPILYSYGFPGIANKNYFMGSSNMDISKGNSSVSNNSFTISAVGDIDGDNLPDIITIDQMGNIKIVQDDLK